MVAGDLVNTASRIQSPPSRAPCSSASRPARDRGGDRLRGRGRARAEGQGGAGAALARAARDGRGRRRVEGRPGWSRRSSDATASCGCVKELFHATAAERKAHARVRRRDRRDRQVAALVGVLQVHGRPRGHDAGGTAAAASPTARASPTGRSPRWCACAPGSREGEEPTRPRARSSPRRSRTHVPDAEERAWSSRASRTCSASRSAGSGERGEPVRGLAAVLRAARRARPGRTRLRGRAVGRRRAARVRRVPARVVARAPDLRPRARAAGARRRHPDWRSGRRSVTRSCSSRSARGHGGAARRRSCPGCPPTSAGAILDAGRGRAALRRRDRPDAARPRAARAGRRRRTGRPGRSRSSRCPRPCTRCIAARLDGLTPEERRLLQDAAVLGKTSRGRRSPRVSGVAGGRARSAAGRRSSARRCSRSGPTRARRSAGSTCSCRTCVRQVAYETLARRERKLRHLAAAALPRAGVGRRGGDRRGRRRALPRGVPAATRTRRTPNRFASAARGRWSFAPVNGQPRSAATEEAQSALRAGDRAHP